MKKQLLFAVMGLTSVIAGAQTFTDNFDSYTAGSNLCPQSSGNWTTWSNAPGGAEDVKVSNADSKSPSNSLYFSSSTSTGGPTDLVKKFGLLSSGQFVLDFNMKIEASKGAYFNLQKTYTFGAGNFESFFNADGTFTMTTSAGNVVTGNYPTNTWFNLKLKVNFNTNTWEILFDDVSKGTFSNPDNVLAAIDLYPVNQVAPNKAGFFVDDFTYTVTPYTPTNLDAAVTELSFVEASLVSNEVKPVVKVRNLGTTAINSFDVNVLYNGVTLTENVSGLTLANMATATVNFTSKHTLIAGSNPMTVTISNINGGADDDASDDTKTITINPSTPATGKIVVSEEGTGTWCQWCPRGAVFMDRMHDKYGKFWAGIAVHNNDPMTYATYDTGMKTKISGYPSSLVDRGAAIDPSAMEPQIITRLGVAPNAVMLNGAKFNTTTRQLDISVSTTFQAALAAGYKIALVLTEDGVRGTSSQYAQVNNYAGGANGVMGGYEALPNPVPASKMVYDHVARVILPSFEGTTTNFPPTIAAGQLHVFNFTYTIPTNWYTDSMHIVALFIAPNGKIDNAGNATFNEAIANGWVEATKVSGVGVTELSQPDAKLNIYPNPASSVATLAIQLDESATVAVRVLDVTGKVVAERNYGILTGDQSIHMNTQLFGTGVYLVEMTIDNEVVTKRLVVE